MKKKINIVVSKAYPKVHKRHGEPTHFAQKIINGEKLHTIRGNYDLWAWNAEKMQSGKYTLSVRQWSGVPYLSTQCEIFTLTAPIGVERITIKYTSKDDSVSVRVEDKYLSADEVEQIAKNDGSTVDDFKDWFFAKHRNHRNAFFKGVIVHFTPFRYAEREIKASNTDYQTQPKWQIFQSRQTS